MRFEEQNNETKITTMLYKIYKKLAGDDAEVDTNLDAYPNDVKVPLLLEKIYEVVDDDSKGSGSGGVFLITFTVTMADMYTVDSVVTDKTYSETLSAIEQGQIVMAKVTGLPTRDQYIPLNSYDSSVIIFSAIQLINGGSILSIKMVSLSSENTAQYIMASKQ